MTRSESRSGSAEDDDESDTIALEEASSIILSVKIEFEKRLGRLTVVERDLLTTIRFWLTKHPPPTGDV